MRREEPRAEDIRKPKKKGQSISAMNVGRRSILGNRWNIS